MSNALRRRLLSGLAAVPVLIGLPVLVRSQGSKPLFIFLTVPPGGSSDTLARMLGEKLRLKLNRPVVIESRPGAGGLLAIRYLRTLDNDGSYLVMDSSSAVSLLPLFTAKTVFDPEQDLQPVVECAQAPIALTVHTAVGIRTLNEYFDAVRLNSDLGSVGVPSPVSMGALLVHELARDMKLPLQVVAYRGDAPLLAHLLGQQVPASGSILSDSLTYHRAGSLRILAHAGEKPSPLAPDIPTFAEAGYPGYVAVTSLGLYAKAGIPRSIADDYAAIVTEALAEQQMVELLHKMGMIPMGGTPAEFRHKVMADRARWAPIVREYGMRMDS